MGFGRASSRRPVLGICKLLAIRGWRPIDVRPVGFEPSGRCLPARTRTAVRGVCAFILVGAVAARSRIRRRGITIDCNRAADRVGSELNGYWPPPVES